VAEKAVHAAPRQAGMAADITQAGSGIGFADSESAGVLIFFKCRMNCQGGTVRLDVSAHPKAEMVMGFNAV
jgi:hypothetical protein